MPTPDGAVGVPVDWRVIVGVEINCARSNDVAGGIEYLFGIAAFEMADLGNLAVLDADVSSIGRHQGSINNRSPFNNRIELCHRSSFAS
jgi:hypothetical protein